MNISQLNEAIDEAERTQRLADINTSLMIKIIAGRLRHAKLDYQTTNNLAKMKKELRDFNMTTKSWNNK